MHLNYILEYCNQSGEEYKMALPEDYYKFVELANFRVFDCQISSNF